jgi:hypothetical protein
MIELWMAWSEHGRYLAAVFGATRERVEMERLIELRKEREPFRAVRVTVQVPDDTHDR